MYNQNSDHPRISFSNDLSVAESSRHRRPVAAYRDAPVSSDFEFSVANYSMISADQLFFKGRLLPLKDGAATTSKTTTLRDELRNDDVERDDSLRPPKNPARWRGFLGLRKSHIGSKKSADKTTPFHQHDNSAQCTNNSSQEYNVD